MRRKYIRPQSQSALWALRFGRPAALLLLLILLLHRFGFIPTQHLPYYVALVSLPAILALLMAVLGLKALWQEGHKGGMASLKGGFLALIALLPLLLAGAGRFVFPPVYDISTDYENPPEFLPQSRPADALPAAGGFSPAAVAAQKAAWPQLSGRRYDGSPDTVLQAVYAVLKAENWQAGAQIGKAGEDSRILVAAAAKTFILGFVSDIVIRLTDEGDTSFVDMRAASRYLRRDYGINARLIDDFMTRLDAEILSLPVDDSND